MSMRLFTEVQALKREIEALKARLEALEGQKRPGRPKNPEKEAA